MKNTILLFALFVGISAFGQEENMITETKDQINLRGLKSGTVYFIDGIPARPLHFDETYFIKGLEVLQPTETNELLSGTMRLSKDLPYVHTLRGYVYTADYLRYTPRY